MLLSDNAALDEAKILHPGKSGYFVICAKDPSAPRGWRQKPLPMRDLENAVSAVKLAPHDRYISQSSYITPSRKAINFQSIRAAYVDLDSMELLGVKPDAYFVEQVLEATHEMGIPAPSVVICSGRGLYCKWYFTHSVTADEMVRWKTLNVALLKMFKSLGADPKIRDLARVLRVIGSINTKVQSDHSDVVRVVHDTGELHDFGSLCRSVSSALVRFHQNVDPSSRLTGFLDGDLQAKLNPASRRVLKDVELLQEHESTNLVGLQNYADIRRPIMITDTARGAASSRYERDVGLNWRRFIDLRNLIVMRGGAPQGTRDQFVFWMLNHLALSGVVTAENFDEEARDLIHLFPQHDGFNPLSEGHLNTLAQKVKLAAAGSTVEIGNRALSHLYTPKTTELVTAFEITGEEQKHMSTLFLPEEKRRRQDEKSPGRAERRESRSERIEVICSLPNTAVAAEVIPVSERQIRRVKERLKNAEKVRLLHDQGMKWAEIARQMSLTERQVKGLLKLATESISKAAVNRVLSPKDKRSQYALQLRAQGLKTADIAAQMGLSERQVRRLFSAAKEAGEMNIDPVGINPEEPPSPPPLPTQFSPEIDTSTTPQISPAEHLLDPLSFFSGLEPVPEDDQDDFDAPGAQGVVGGSSGGRPIQTIDAGGSLKDGDVSEYLQKFSRISAENIHEGALAGPQRNMRPDFSTNKTSPASPGALPSFAQRHARLLQKAEDAKKRIAQAKLQGEASSALADVAPQYSEPTQPAPSKTQAVSEENAQGDPFGDSLYEGYPEDGLLTSASPPPPLPLEPEIGSATKETPLGSHPAGLSLSQGSTRPSFQPALSTDKRSGSLSRRLAEFQRPVAASDSDNEDPPFFDEGESGAAESRAPSARPSFSSPPLPASRPSKRQDKSLDPPWEDDFLPAGSAYTAAEWSQARGVDNEFSVVEFVAGKERALIRFPTAPKPVLKAVGMTKADAARGQYTRVFESPSMPKTLVFSAVVGECFDGCIILGPRGHTDFPNHVRHGAVVVKDPMRESNQKIRDGKDFVYGVIEPRVMRNEHGRGAVLNIETGSFFPDSQCHESEDDAPIGQDAGESASPRERSRGG